MFALTVLLFLAVYVLISLGVIRAARAAARRRGGRPWLWGWVATIAMYHLVFWDLIPTAILYPWYQAREAGVWVYKTPEQWLSKNPAYRQLPPPVGTREKLGLVEVARTMPELSVTRYMNGFHVTSTETHIWPHILREKRVLLSPDGETVIARGVFFISGDCRPQSMRFWTARCSRNGTKVFKDTQQFFGIVENFRDMGVTTQ